MGRRRVLRTPTPEELAEIERHKREWGARLASVSDAEMQGLFVAAIRELVLRDGYAAVVAYLDHWSSRLLDAEREGLDP